VELNPFLLGSPQGPPQEVPHDDNRYI
jgi:hypothetical protein